MLLDNFELHSGSIPKDMRVLMRKVLQQLSCFNTCWNWSVLAESTFLVSENLPNSSHKQLCRDMELTLMNDSANHAVSLIEFVFRLDDGVVGCGGGNGEAEHVPQQFHRCSRWLA